MNVCVCMEQNREDAQMKLKPRLRAADVKKQGKKRIVSKSFSIHHPQH